MQEFLYNFLNFKEILNWFKENSITLILGVILIILYNKIYQFVLKIFEKYILPKIKEPGLRTFIKSFIKIGIHIGLIYSIIMIFGFNFTSAFAILGAISVVLGFAFKEIIGNILGGMMLLIFKPFKVNDTIQFGDYIGTVYKIEIFYTRLINFQNELVIIPNGILVNTEVRNITVKNKRRLDLTIGVDYNSNISKVKEILNEIADSCVYRVPNEPIRIGLIEMAASSLNFITNIYVNTNNYLDAKIWMLETIKNRFDEEGISIPFNQLDVFIKNETIKEIK